MSVLRGERGSNNKGFTELAQRFEVMTPKIHDKLVKRMQVLVDRLQARARAAAPLGKTGNLRANITGAVYADEPTRIAGYVTILDRSGNPKKEYPKAATLEYGSSKVRRIMADLRPGAKRRILARVTKPVTIVARRYLRGSLEGMQAEAEAEMAAGLAEAVQEEQ